MKKLFKGPYGAYNKKQIEVILVINEQHTLLVEQKKVLTELNCSVKTHKIPAQGLSLEQQKSLLQNWSKEGLAKIIIFASPVPALLCLAAGLQGNYEDIYPYNSPSWGDKILKVAVFHNDRREKKELPGGKVIMTVAPEGWELAYL